MIPLLQDKAYKDTLFAKNEIPSLLLENKFDLSQCMGDIFSDAIKLDALSKMQNLAHLLFSNTELDIAMKNQNMWGVAQKRHLIVHRRGIVDANYLEKTSDKATIGTQLIFDAIEVEKSISMVRDIGLTLIQAALGLLL